eukprot:scaffold14790_cov138-Isochrysis_galbana.AAC.2
MRQVCQPTLFCNRVAVAPSLVGALAAGAVSSVAPLGPLGATGRERVAIPDGGERVARVAPVSLGAEPPSRACRRPSAGETSVASRGVGAFESRRRGFGTNWLGGVGVVEAIHARDDIEELVDLVDLARNLLITGGRRAHRRWQRTTSVHACLRQRQRRTREAPRQTGPQPAADPTHTAPAGSRGDAATLSGRGMAEAAALCGSAAWRSSSLAHSDVPSPACVLRGVPAPGSCSGGRGGGGGSGALALRLGGSGAPLGLGSSSDGPNGSDAPPAAIAAPSPMLPPRQDPDMAAPHRAA